jgi:MraZ protein
MAGLNRFIGSHEVAVDPKGRIHLPARVRETLEHGFDSPLILTIGPERSLIAYPAQAWSEKYEALMAEPFSPERERKLRLVSAYAAEAPIKNDRILIPPRLREYAELGKEGVIVGRMKKIEIWSAPRFRDQVGGSDDQIAAELADLGF